MKDDMIFPLWGWGKGNTPSVHVREKFDMVQLRAQWRLSAHLKFSWGDI